MVGKLASARPAAAPRVVTPAEADADRARTVAEAVAAVPGVVRLDDSGVVPAAVRIGSGVPGVRVGPNGTAVTIVAATGVPLPALAEAVRTAAGAIVGYPVDVEIADLETGAPEGASAPRSPAVAR